MLVLPIPVVVGVVVTSAPNETDLYSKIAALPDPNTKLEDVKNVSPIVGLAHQRFGGADRIREYRLGYQRM